MSTLKTTKTRIEKLDFSDKIYVYLSSGDILSLPYTYTEKISASTKDVLKQYRLIADGIGIHFEEIDEDISLNGIIAYKTTHELIAS